MPPSDPPGPEIENPRAITPSEGGEGFRGTASAAYPTAEPAQPETPGRRRPRGVPTTDLVLSAHVGTSADVFPQILQLYVPPGSVVADTTYGRGVFWRNVPPGAYTVHATDLQQGVDARALPYADDSLDAVVFDPPWMVTSSGRTHESGGLDASAYRNNERDDGGLKYTDAILALYLDAAREARRVLKPGGVHIVKCQDQVHANRQWFLHVDLLVSYAAMGLVREDLFVQVRTGKPGVSRLVKQAHARKNHSLWLVVRKPRGAPATAW